VTCEPGWSWSAQPTDYDILVVHAGTGHVSFGGESHPLVAGTAVMLRPGQPAIFAHDKGEQLTIAFCHFRFMNPMSGQPVVVDEDWLPNVRVQLCEPSNVANLIQQVVRWYRDPNPLRQLDSRSRLLCLLIEIYLQDARSAGVANVLIDSRIRRVRDLVVNSPGAVMSLADAASHAGMSPKHFSRIFSSNVGASYREFCLQSRLDQAQVLLTESAMSVTEIARTLGYRDVFTFSRQYRRRFGQPPTAIRRVT
jgi:AraC-like DNA-binding protein